MIRSTVVSIFAFLIVVSGLAFAQDGPPPGPPLGRPPLVECVEGEAIPCVQIVDEIEDIVGTWRRYFSGNDGMAFSTFASDGSLNTALGPGGETILSTVYTFEDGLVSTAARERPGIPPSCIEPGIYEARLLRLGEQPVALTFLQVEDSCPGRIADSSEPLIYYTGTDVPSLRPGNVHTQSLIPCPDEVSDDEAAYPCDVIATSPEDIAGVWRQYVGHPAFAAVGGMGYIHYNSDGSFVLADSLENTLTPNEAFPFGTVSFDDKEMTFTVDSEVPPGCETAVYYFRVIRVGEQPVAIVPSPVNDECVRRREGDMAEALIWVGEE